MRRQFIEKLATCVRVCVCVSNVFVIASAERYTQGPGSRSKTRRLFYSILCLTIKADAMPACADPSSFI